MSGLRNEMNIDVGLVFSKTQLGHDEILRRQVGLPNDLRGLLLLIDGRRDINTLRSISMSLRESLAPLIFLEDNGFVVRSGVTAERASTVVPMTLKRGGLLSDIHDSHMAQQQILGSQRPAAEYQAPVQPSYQTPESVRNEPQFAPPRHNIGELKSALIQFVSAALGADAAHAIGRIQGAGDLLELQQIAKRIYEVLKDYSGVRTAERFMQQFEGPLQLR
jgi:hypothetical protein